MPLQASATSSFIRGSTMTFPSRRTGTPKRGSRALASLEARICSGKVIWLKTIAGMGMASKRTSRAKRNSFKNCRPPKQSTSPASKMSSETLREEELGTVDPQKQNDQSQGNHGNSTPGRSELNAAKGLSLFPHQISREQGHQEAVREIGYLPPVGNEFHQHLVINSRDQQADHRRTQRKLSVAGAPAPDGAVRICVL